MSTSGRGRSNYAAVTNRTWQILWHLLHKRFHSFSLFYFLPSVYVRSWTCASVGVLFMSVFMRMWIGVYYKQQIPPNCHWCRRALMSKRGWRGQMYEWQITSLPPRSPRTTGKYVWWGKMTSHSGESSRKKGCMKTDSMKDRTKRKITGHYIDTMSMNIS